MISRRPTRLGMVARFGLLGWAVLLFAGAQPARARVPDLKSRADALVEATWPKNGPGAAVIIAHRGKVVYVRGRGLADVASRTPITSRTVFRLGSITKQFAAAVILQLAAEKKLSLEDPLSKYLPDFPRPGADATIAQLLSHMSGIQSYTKLPGWMLDERNTDRPYTTEQMVALFKDLPTISAPGQEWSYNNSGYVLIGAVIEKITGRPWYAAVEDRIAKPLGLRTLGSGVGEESVLGMAKGYTQGEKGPRPPRRIHMSVPHAAGGLIGTVEDLAKWAKALHHGQVVSGELYGRMISPARTVDGRVVHYGLGLEIEQLGERKTIGHGGGIFGFSTESIYLPDVDLFIGVLANSDQPGTTSGSVARRLAALALGEPRTGVEQNN